jgi:hypothetical protein
MARKPKVIVSNTQQQQQPVSNVEMNVTEKQPEHPEQPTNNNNEHPEEEQNKLNNQEGQEPPQKIPKKRGRKPKGGKIIQTDTPIEQPTIPEPNIILHLKCGLADINKNNQFLSNVVYRPEVETIDAYQYQNPTHTTYYELGMSSTLNQFNQNNSMQYEQQNTNTNTKHQTTDDCNTLNAYMDLKEIQYQKMIHLKLQELTVKLHINHMIDKKSACFWCSCDFDNPPIYIPKHELNGIYDCYGCFCSPECATSYLFKEHIDSSTKFERYHLLNHIYCKIYNYSKNIKPAPDPFYTLDKFYGNLSIQEYRRLLKNERLLLIVDKPLARSMPELYEDNNDFVIQSHLTVPSSNNQLKVRVSNKQKMKNSFFDNPNTNVAKTPISVL